MRPSQDMSLLRRVRGATTEFLTANFRFLLLSILGLLQFLLGVFAPVYWFLLVLGGGTWEPWVRRTMFCLQTLFWALLAFWWFF